MLFPINPLTLARSRVAVTPSHAKNDSTDAQPQLEVLVKHRDKLKPLNPESPQMRALEQLVRHRRRLVDDKVRISNRLTSALKSYFPQLRRIRGESRCYSRECRQIRDRRRLYRSGKRR